MEAKTTNKRKRKELDRKEIKDEYSEIRKPYEVRIRSNGFGFTDNAKALFKTNSSLSKDMKKNTKYSKIVDIFNKYKIVTLTGFDKNIIKTINTAEKVKRLLKCTIKQGTEIYEIKLDQYQEETKADSVKIVPAISITLE